MFKFFRCIESFNIQPVISLVSGLVWFGHPCDVPVVFHPCNLPITPIMETQSEVSKAISVISFLVLVTRAVNKKEKYSHVPPSPRYNFARSGRTCRDKTFLSFHFRHVVIQALCRDTFFHCNNISEKRERNASSCANTFFPLAVADKLKIMEFVRRVAHSRTYASVHPLACFCSASFSRLCGNMQICRTSPAGFSPKTRVFCIYCRSL